MGQFADPHNLIEANASPVPMILPLSPREHREGAKEGDCPNFCANKNGTVPLDVQRQPPNASPAKLHYAFPMLPPPRRESPKVCWPMCPDTEEADAYAIAADRIADKLSKNLPEVLAFTSPCDGDGKTSVLLGIAPELAKVTGRNILVVDANFHKPDLVARLTLPANRMTIGSPLIFPTNHHGLNVLLPSSQWQGLDFAWLERFRENWPLVLVDLPSLEHAEATALLRHCSGVYMTVRLGHTPRHAISEAARLIPNHGGRLLGCLVIGEESQD
jgi:Mrp family chromosome partitioning ATPase